MAALYANPLEDPGAWDFIIVAGAVSPGLFKLTGGGSRSYLWDVKAAAGAQGSTETYRGWKVSDGIKGTFTFWLQRQIDEFFATFLPLLEYDATKANPKPVDVQYPPLMANDVFSMVTEEIGPLHDAGNQLWTVEVGWIEYRPAKKKNVTTTPNTTQTTAPGAANAQKPTVLDAQDRAIQQLTIEAQKPV